MLGAGAVSLAAMGFGQDSSNQNCAEFIGAVIAVACALRMGRREQSVTLRGDSVTALTWAEKWKARGNKALGAGVVFAQLAAAGQLDLRKAHILAAHNWRTDLLSRRSKWAEHGHTSVREILDSWGPDYQAVPVLELDTNAAVQELLSLCRPQEGGHETEQAFAAIWTRAARAARELATQASEGGASAPARAAGSQ